MKQAGRWQKPQQLKKVAAACSAAAAKAQLDIDPPQLRGLSKPIKAFLALATDNENEAGWQAELLGLASTWHQATASHAAYSHLT